MRNPLDGAKNILGRNPLYGSLISQPIGFVPNHISNGKPSHKNSKFHFLGVQFKTIQKYV